jgi:hypothetical protein
MAAFFFLMVCGYYSLYYFCIIMWKFPSGVADAFVPTPVEVFFLPPWRRHPPPVDKFVPGPVQFADLGFLRAGIFPDDPDHPLVAVFDGDKDEPLFLQRADVGADLAFTDAKEFGEVAVGCVAAIGVVERMNFHEENFFHQ